MALRLRRGTDADRLSTTFKSGELVYTTDTKKVYVGDGTTSGGVPLDSTLASINELNDVDTSSSPPAAGEILSWNGSNWVPFDPANLAIAIDEGSNYRINIVAEDSSIMVDTSTNQFDGNLTGDVLSQGGSTLLSSSTNTLNADVIGSVTGNVEGNVKGNVLANDDSLIVDYTSKVVTGNFVGDIEGNLTGDVVSQDGSTLIINSITNNINAESIITGSIVGDLIGSVFSDNSSLLVDAINNSLSANLISLSGTGGILIQDSSELAISVSDGVSPTRLRLDSYTSGPNMIINMADSSSTSGPGIDYNVSRGTLDNPTDVLNGDILTINSASGYAGGSYVTGSVITSYVDPNGTISGSQLPGSIGLLTFNDGTVNDLRGLIIDSNRNTGVNRQTADSLNATLDINGFMFMTPLSSPPATLVEGLIAVADRINWDPVSKGTGNSYPVYYDGAAWNAFY